MKSRFRLAAATAALALVAAFAAGCTPHGSRRATSDATAPVNDADWHSLVKSGRGCYPRNDFKAALPLFVSAANRSRALDDPNGLAVALLDQARCLEEMDVAAVLSAFDRAAATAEPAAGDLVPGGTGPSRRQTPRHPYRFPTGSPSRFQLRCCACRSHFPFRLLQDSLARM